MSVTDRFVRNEDVYRQLYGKFPPVSQEEIELFYDDTLVCDCGGGPLTTDAQPRVNASVEGYFYKCESCRQRWLFILSSRELVKAQ